MQFSLLRMFIATAAFAAVFGLATAVGMNPIGSFVAAGGMTGLVLFIAKRDADRVAAVTIFAVIGALFGCCGPPPGSALFAIGGAVAGGAFGGILARIMLPRDRR